MKPKLFKLLSAVLLLALITTSFGSAFANNSSPVPAGPPISDGKTTSTPKASHRLIVELQSEPLAVRAKDSVNFLTRDGSLDLTAPQAQIYRAQLQAEQSAFVANMQAQMPTAKTANFVNENGQAEPLAYQVVFNGVVVDPGDMDQEIARKQLAALPGVKAVYLDRAHEPNLYASLPLINSEAAWNNPEVGGMANAGAGIKFASMDGGVHHDAPMFDGTGYSYPEGWPANGLGDSANNNGKIIASRVYFRDWDPPAPGDENSWPGTNGTSHGVHTASTAAGNQVVADYLGITESISGVAPAAWVMSYRVFYNSITGDGSFYDAEGIAALEDIAMDGADVLNNSWGGGPSSAGGEFDALDAALINVANSGVFVSMSAGNAGPGLGTSDHPSDEYIGVAATTSGGTYASGRLYITEPEPVSPALQDLSFASAGFGGSLPAGEVITYSYRTATAVDSANFEGCNAFPADAFTGFAAVISRGSCEFGVKVLNAEQAGAEFVVIHNNASGGDALINMAPGAVGHLVTIPSIFVGHTDGVGIVDWYATNGDASVLEMNMLAFQVGNTPDVVADFSSRGPGVGNVLKPDIAAPGVNIMAQGYTPGASGEDRHLGYGQASGTSMASPHVAGAAALLRQIHPDWSNADIKSALMSTSKYLGVWVSDGSHAQPLDMGAGRLDMTNAADPGVILDPPSLSFGQMVTGTQETMTVMVTSVADSAETYDLSAIMVEGTNFMTVTTGVLPGFTISPTSITLAAGESGSFTVSFDTDEGVIGDNQGYIILDGDSHEAHMPVWARISPEPSADVLIIQNDMSLLLGYDDYLTYYTDALDDLGITYNVWSADANFNNPVTIPEAAVLSAYKAVIYFTGDHYQPDGTFTVATPLTALDQNRLTEYANQGGIIFAMGQDLSAVLGSDATDDGTFFYGYNLGGNWLQDSVTGYSSPQLPVVAAESAPAALQGVSLDLSAPSWNMVDLFGGNEVPPVNTTTSGVAYFAYDNANSVLDYDITISSPVSVSNPVTVTASHIHTGDVGENGPVAITLYAGPDAAVYKDNDLNFYGSIQMDASEAATLLSGGYYVNVHTADHPSGEIRGQVIADVNGDGAGNQYYIDELSVSGDDFTPLLKYPGPYNMENGVVAVAHRDQPSLESPGISYFGRSIYTSFGLEGVNNGLGGVSREDLMEAFFTWAMDEPTVTITKTNNLADTTPMTIFEAELSSNMIGTSGVSYRWDFGDGSDFVGPYESSIAGWAYDVCGDYTVRVEATDSWGNVAIGNLDVSVTQCEANILYLPLINK